MLCSLITIACASTCGHCCIYVIVGDDIIIMVWHDASHFALFVVVGLIDLGFMSIFCQYVSSGLIIERYVFDLCLIIEIDICLALLLWCLMIICLLIIVC